MGNYIYWGKECKGRCYSAKSNNVVFSMACLWVDKDPDLLWSLSSALSVKQGDIFRKLCPVLEQECV